MEVETRENEKRKWALAAWLLAPALALGSPGTAAAQGHRYVIPVKVYQVKPLAADPAAHRIEVTLVKKLSSTEARLRVTGVVRNIGPVMFDSRPQRSAVELRYGSQLIGRRFFKLLDAGQEIRISADITWRKTRVGEEFPSTVTLKIVHNALNMIGGGAKSPQALDANLGNNSRTCPYKRLEQVADSVVLLKPESRYPRLRRVPIRGIRRIH